MPKAQFLLVFNCCYDEMFDIFQKSSKSIWTYFLYVNKYAEFHDDVIFYDLYVFDEFWVFFILLFFALFLYCLSFSNGFMLLLLLLRKIVNRKNRLWQVRRHGGALS